MRFAPTAGGALAAAGLALGLATIPAPAHAAPITCDEAALVDAVEAANLAGGGTIELAPDCVYSLDTAEPPVGANGPNGLPVITEAITINGSNSVIERATATGTPKFRLFEVGGTDGELTLNRVTLRNGNPTVDGSEDGGAILVDAGRVLVVNSSVLSGNTAQEGGAVASLTGSSTTISSSIIKDNVALFGGGGLYNLGGSLTVGSSVVSDNKAHHGSGIHNLGTLILQSSVVRNNSAPVTGGAGGGVYNTGTATISSSSVQTNTAGIGGGLFNLTGSTTVNSSAISGNTAADEGGGIRNYATLNLNSTSLANNKVTAAGSRGGGLYNGTGTATLTHTSVRGNSAVLEAGGIYEDTGGTVDLVTSPVNGNSPNNCRPSGAVPGCVN
ncbi:hypothetical protein [Streptomyces aurantiogriseus]|uniref:CSLREA domain-containing protein n=1 Tax=Streptomyces aurantiogriseus TaxID=66870 RepID=A0A918F4X3_9ACTN|nr:hypothetical protein [Streptomyces aurantiogriseus]GGR01662.1 hypothetical protein GCM10010251_16630 [Streptomyces aurantiogriseus]